MFAQLFEIVRCPAGSGKNRSNPLSRIERIFAFRLNFLNFRPAAARSPAAESASKSSPLRAARQGVAETKNACYAAAGGAGMSGLRREVMEWLADGRVVPGGEHHVLRAAGIAPSRAGWRLFLGQISLWLGTAALAAAIIFFFAFNWDALGRFTKFGLVEGAILAVLVACWRFDLDRPAGKAALVLLSLLTGALLALTGQVYQTGADTFELFAWWALLILPWVLVSRFSPHWLLWLAVANFAVLSCADAAVFANHDIVLWILLALDTAALAAWEAAHRAGIAWLRDDWPPRLVVIPAGVAATALSLEAIADSRDVGPVLAHIVWIVCILGWYRRVRLDLFMLAGALLSAVVVVAGFMILHFLGEGAGGFLLVALMIVAMAGGGATWLRSLAREAQA
jgi:uncharacterized membrane protein